MLDPDVVFRARGAPEFRQELKGAADVAGRFATFGPRFASRCHPATVNGQPGLVINAGDGPSGAVGFTVSGGLITTVDLTLDPANLEAFDQLLGNVRGRRGSVAEQLVGEALGWPGVYQETGRLGLVVLRVDGYELGHLHSDAVADIPLPSKLQDQAVNDGVALKRDSGWVTVPLQTEEGVQQALALLRGNYARRRARTSPVRPPEPA